MAFTSSRRVTALADRYTGRHIRQARHGAWVNKKRSHTKPVRQLLPTAAALTVASILIGGGALVVKFGPPSPGIQVSSAYDAADYPPADRNAQAARAGRVEPRPSAVETATTPTTPGPVVAQPPAATEVQPVLQGNASVISTGSCEASFHDQRQETANGETFDPSTLTAAHKRLPFNSQVRVTNLANGKSIVVRINDRGPYVSGRCLDLSRAAFGAIANLGVGVVDVRYEVLAPAGS
jgi:rare lipoprotein A